MATKKLAKRRAKKPSKKTAKHAPWIRHKGALGGPGFARKSRATRRALLILSVKRSGYRTTLGRVSVLLRDRALHPSTRARLEEDREWLVRTFGGKSHKYVSVEPKHMTSVASLKTKKTPKRSRFPSEGLTREEALLAARTRRKPKKTPKPRPKFPREVLQLRKGLTREEAIRAARGRWKRDHRGFTYNPKTGKAVAV